MLLEWIALSPLFIYQWVTPVQSCHHLLSCCSVYLDEMVFNINLTNSLCFWLTLIPCTLHYHFFTFSSCVEHHYKSSIARIELSFLMWCIELLETFLGHSHATKALAAVACSFDSQNVTKNKSHKELLRELGLFGMQKRRLRVRERKKNKKTLPAW